MQFIVHCWEGCDEEFTVNAPSRGTDALTDGIETKCPHCGRAYRFTVDGDGEPELASLNKDSMGDVVTDPEATNF